MSKKDSQGYTELLSRKNGRKKKGKPYWLGKIFIDLKSQHLGDKKQADLHGEFQAQEQ